MSQHTGPPLDAALQASAPPLPQSLPPPAPAPRTPGVLSDFDRLGRVLEDLVRRGGNSHLVEAIAKRMQPGLLEITRRRLDEKAFPLPELLVAGLAVEWVLLDAANKPSVKQFSERFAEMLDPVFEYCRLRGMYIDRYLLEQDGVTSRRRQARIAAVVEATMKEPIERRRIVCAFLRGEKTTAEVAAALGCEEREVRKVLANVFREGMREAPEWIRKWQRVTAPPKKTKSKKPRAT